MAESNSEDNARKEAAKLRSRDEHGHFIHQATETIKEISEITHTGKDDQKVLKVEVNDPSAKWFRLLDQIKKQKALNFTLKGSLGLMGVVLTLSVIGIFGSSYMLCDKGTQTQLGVLKQLTFKDEPFQIPLLGQVINIIKRETPQSETARIILQKADNSLIRIISSQETVEKFLNQPVFISGPYDSCASTLKLKNTAGIEEYK